MKTTKNLVTIALGVVSLLIGCSVIPKYPSQLPPLVACETKLGVCPEIAGHYLDKGEAFTIKGISKGTVSLSQLLHEKDCSITNADDVMVMGPQQDVIEITSLRDGKPFATLRQPKFTTKAYLDKGDAALAQTYVCQEGFVRLRLEQSSSGCAAGIAVFSDGLWARKAEDALIVLHAWGGGGIVAIVPFAYGKTRWCRFPPVEENAPPDTGGPRTGSEKAGLPAPTSIEPKPEPSK
jgi:hypothetical protein